MFEIKVHYRETDSFNSYERTDSIGASFNTLEEARECLQAAREHHEYILETDRLSRNGRPLGLSPEQLIEQSKLKSWFDTSVDEEDYSYDSIHTFNFKGNSINSFYNGCSNTLYSMSIVFVPTDEDKINFKSIGAI